MKPPEQVKREFVRDWLDKADADFRMSHHLLQGGLAFFFGSAFHAQQAAEKYIKAFLIWHQIEFTKTHDIQKLLELAGLTDSDLPEMLKESVELNIYSVTYRYPGDIPELSESEVSRAITLAEQVRDTILNRIPKDLLLPREEDSDGTLV